MNLFMHYFQIQLKRMVKSFPSIFFTTILLFLAICSLFVAQININRESPKTQKYNIGLVGNLDESYLGFGLDTIEKIDSSRFTIKFLEMSEEAAQDAVRNNKITAYVRIPDNFVDALIHGKDTRITFVCGSSQNTLGTEIVKELVLSISKIVSESQAALYSAYHLYNGKTESDTHKDLQQLNIQYFDLILGREGLYDLKTCGGTNGLSLEAYLFCSATIIFLLFWGITSSSILTKKDMAMSELLAARGIPPTSQCAGEYLSFFIFMSFNCYLLITVLLLLIKLKGSFLFQEKKLFYILIILWLIILCISSLLYLIYNLCQSLSSGILMNFVIALLMGYFSGCFYPISYFPAVFQKTAVFLPTGISMQLLTKYLKNENWVTEGFTLLLYTLIFLLISIFVRKRKLNR